MGAIRTDNEASASADPYALASCSVTCADRVEQLLAGIRPGNSSLDRRTRITAYMQSVVSACFSDSHASVHLVAFGSVPLMTFLPDGDIDLSIMSADHSLKDVWATKLFNWLEEESSRVTADYKITNVQIINAEVKLLKCLVDNIVVDISYHQVGGITALRFLEEVDQMLAGHIFKRSIILVKAWCYYESRVLGAHHGLFSTYALEVLVLYVFNLHHKRIKHPIEVLYLFLVECSRFDWDHYCLCLKGRIPLASFPNPTVEALVSEPLLTPEVEAECLRRAREYELGDMQTGTSTPPSTPAGTGTPGADAAVNQVTRPGFSIRAINIQDPLQPTNNVGRSVTKGNLFRVRKAFAYGAATLSKILSKDGHECCAAIDDFFRNVWNAQRQGRQPTSYSSLGGSLWSGQPPQTAMRQMSDPQQQQHLAYMMLQRMVAGNRLGAVANGNGLPVLYAPSAGDLHLNNLLSGGGQQGQGQQGAGQSKGHVRGSGSNTSSMPTTPVGGRSATPQGSAPGIDDSLVNAVLSAAHLAAIQAVGEPGQQGVSQPHMDPSIAGGLYSNHPLMIAYNQQMMALAAQHGHALQQPGEGHQAGKGGVQAQGRARGHEAVSGDGRQLQAGGQQQQQQPQQVPTPTPASSIDVGSFSGPGSEHGGSASVDTLTSTTPEPILDAAAQHGNMMGKLPLQGNPALGAFLNAAWLPALTGQFLGPADGSVTDPQLLQSQQQALVQHLRQAAAFQALQHTLHQGGGTQAHQQGGSMAGSAAGSDAAGLGLSAGGSSVKGEGGSVVGDLQGGGGFQGGMVDSRQSGVLDDHAAALQGKKHASMEGPASALHYTGQHISHRHSSSSPAVPDPSSLSADTLSKVSGVVQGDKDGGSGDGKGGAGSRPPPQQQHPHPAAAIYHSRFNAALVGGLPGSMEAQFLGLSPPMPYYANMPPPPPPALAHNIQHSPPSLSFPAPRALGTGRAAGPAPMWPPQGMHNHNQAPAQRANNPPNASQQQRAPQQLPQLSPQTSESLPSQVGPSSHDGSSKPRRQQGSATPTAGADLAPAQQLPAGAQQQGYQMKTAFRSDGAAAAAAVAAGGSAGEVFVAGGGPGAGQEVAGTAAGTAAGTVTGRSSRSGRGHGTTNQDLERDGSSDLMWQPSDAWSEDPPP